MVSAIYNIIKLEIGNQISGVSPNIWLPISSLIIYNIIKLEIGNQILGETPDTWKLSIYFYIPHE